MIVHHTISDLYHTLGLPCSDGIDFTIFPIPDIHPEIPFKSPVLRANYYSLILTIDGAGNYYLDENKFTFASQSFYFTNPGHIKSYELQESNEAYIITLTEGFLQDHVHTEIYGAFPFLLAEKVPPQQLSPDDLQEFETLFKQILHEFGSESSYKNKILGHLVHVLLLKVHEKFWAKYDPMEEGKRDSQIVRSFKRLIEAELKKAVDHESGAERLQVQFLAEKLHLHPNYLNSVIKRKTGMTVNDWISNRTLSVAKSLLLNTTDSAKQIAYRLGFSEPTHFSRFFKKHTQQSPGQFRKSPEV